MSFETELNRVEAGMVRGLGRLVGELALSTFQTLVLASPVGDPNLWESKPPPGYTGGRFRGNWQVSLNATLDTQLDTIDKSGSITIAQGKAVIRGAKFGDKIVLQNNLPYAVRLNEGHSRQAPIGFVQQSLTIGINSLDGKRVDFT
jgi:hypothetical protein